MLIYQGKAQAQAPTAPALVTVYEVARVPHGYEPTGRKFLLASDAPIWQHWGETGRQAIKDGNLALIAPLFEEVLSIVQGALA